MDRDDGMHNFWLDGLFVDHWLYNFVHMMGVYKY